MTRYYLFIISRNSEKIGKASVGPGAASGWN
jgi:hypothetical protein